MTRKQSGKRSSKKKTQDDVGLRISILLVWLLVGLYAGIAGWTDISLNDLIRKAAEVQCEDLSFEYNGETFCTEADISVEKRSDQITNLGLQWVSHLPDPLPMLMTAFSFGALGSIVRIFRNTIGAQGFSNFYTLTLSPALGGLTALMLLGLSFLLPSAFANEKISFTSSLVPFLSLFAGAFSDHIQRWFQIIMEKIFGTQKEKTDAT